MSQPLFSQSPRPQRVRAAKKTTRQEVVYQPPPPNEPNRSETENDDEQPLASNQLQHREPQNDDAPRTSTSQTPPPPEVDEDFEQEWAQMSILTQYIGQQQLDNTAEQQRTEDPEEDEYNIQTELSTLKTDFLTKTETLDRGEKHLEALDRVVSRRRIPKRLQITIQPQVLFKEDPEFQVEWNEAKLECELRLINILRKHLRLRVIHRSKATLRNLGKDTFVRIRRYASNSRATDSIDKVLQEADAERKQRNELRAKRKLEANNNDRRGQQQQQGKRRKPESSQ